MAEAVFLAHLLVIAEEADRRRRCLEVKTIRDSTNPFHLPDAQFVKAFSLSKDGVRYLCDSLKDRLQRQRRSGVPVETQVLAALRFFTIGKYQRNVGNDSLISVSQSTMSRAIRVVARGIYEVLAREWIKFPQTTEERATVMERFEETFEMRRVLGCLDTCHIAITKPAEHDEGYKNGNGFTSLNVQVVVSSDLQFLSVNSRYPGSVHKSFIWQYSLIKEEMKRLWDSGETSWLIGNSDYPLEPWLLTPVAEATEGSPEWRFNNSLEHSRKCVKNALYHLLNTFKCIGEGKMLHYKPVDAAIIVVACVVLHNLRLHHGLVDVACDDDRAEYEEVSKVNENPQEMESGERVDEAEKVRSMLIQNYWDD
ncbi:putative nuclease HARBI1 [Ischnura elegans]|uniref:putative nuclease HARBI1 n=1 Tax=Ischnura elegans TaxID=197161 RepID=UPI001ED8B08F|nr:putative nuclease HARBI1 [Ischnura elegans]